MQEIFFFLKRTQPQKKGKTLCANNEMIIKNRKTNDISTPFFLDKLPITEWAACATFIDPADRNFTLLQIMIGSDMMTDVCSC